MSVRRCQATRGCSREKRLKSHCIRSRSPQRHSSPMAGIQKCRGATRSEQPLKPVPVHGVRSSRQTRLGSLGRVCQAARGSLVTADAVVDLSRHQRHRVNGKPRADLSSRSWHPTFWGTTRQGKTGRRHSPDAEPLTRAAHKTSRDSGSIALTE